MVKTIEVSGINLKYGKQNILNNVGISVFSGKITALIGPNGAGKSSLFRILAGLVHPESGEVKIDTNRLYRIEDLRKYCGYMLETPDFYKYLTGLKNLEILIHLTGAKNEAYELLKFVGLAGESEKKVQHYSRGMKQRLGFAQALIGDHDFLILDEPFNGLDPEVKDQMLGFLVSLKKQGKGIIVSTHQLEDIETIADNFVLLNKGNIYWEGKMSGQTHNRQNVTLYFSKPLPELKDLKNNLTVSSNQIKMMADIEETEKILADLYKRELIPYRVTRSSLLHDKYMEIAQ